MRSIASILLCFLVSLCACEKNESNRHQSPPEIKGSLVNSARLFFEKQFAVASHSADATSSSGFWSKVDRTPLWSEAIVSKQPSGEFVIVPLKFSKAVNLSSNLDKETIYSAENKIKLVMKRDADGSFKSWVYTYLPQDEKIIQTKRFSGILRIEDWKGSSARNLLFENGRYKELDLDKNSQTVQHRDQIANGNSDGTTCYVYTLWDCEVDNFGYRYNCEKKAVIVLGCYNSQGEETDWVDPPTNNTGDGNGSEIYNEDQYFSTSVEESDQEGTQGENGTEYTDEFSQMITMNVGYSWPGVYGRTLVLGYLYNWAYWSYETAVVEKAHIADPWTFQGTPSHSSIQRIGTTPPLYEYSHDLGYAVCNVIMPAKRRALMELKFVIYERIVGPGGIAQTQSWEKKPKTYLLAP